MTSICHSLQLRYPQVNKHAWTARNRNSTRWQQRVIILWAGLLPSSGCIDFWSQDLVGLVYFSFWKFGYPWLRQFLKTKGEKNHIPTHKLRKTENCSVAHPCNNFTYFPKTLSMHPSQKRGIVPSPKRMPTPRTDIYEAKYRVIIPLTVVLCDWSRTLFGGKVDQ